MAVGGTSPVVLVISQEGSRRWQVWHARSQRLADAGDHAEPDDVEAGADAPLTGMAQARTEQSGLPASVPRLP